MKFKSFGFLTLVLSLSLIVSCSEAFHYLDGGQKEIIKSARYVQDTKGVAWEIDYTADYRLDEFLDKIKEGEISTAKGCRTTMKNLIAKDSPIAPTGRLSNFEPGCSSVICKNDKGKSVIGRNYDLDINSNGAVVVIHTAPKNGYKSVGIADGGQCGLSFNDLKNGTPNRELLLYTPYFTMDGVNEKGFACSIMLLN